MKTMKHRKSIVLALAAVMAVVIAVTGSTFAWFTATDAKKNHFETAKISDGTATLYEVFKEPKEWLPDQEVIKNVGASNTGSNDILVRISFEEVLDKLTSEAKAKSTHYATGEVPVEFDDASYTVANGWISLADALIADPTLSVDTDVATELGPDAYSTILVKTQTINPGSVTGTESTGYSFVFWYPISAPGTLYDGLKQSAKADLYIDESTDHTSKVLKVAAGSAKFYSFDGRGVTDTAWAAFVAPQTSAAVALGTAAELVNSHLDALIHFNYDALSATPETDKWFYNEDDGFFYFIGHVEPGTISPLLLESVTLDASANSQYTSMLFDLYVNLEAIQPLESAVTAASGWNVSNTAILNALTAAGAYDVIE
ncbi:MAG: SipW-dependent-type signal peptide-containing protein [Oscillospiraceae bacterium]|nr:SipW-dependent-type signal peptide-containing protein [Oscillospiraceae bacterium]